MAMVSFIQRMPRKLCALARTSSAVHSCLNRPMSTVNESKKPEWALRFGSGDLPVAFDDEPEDRIIPARVPRRRWMSVAELITEVEVALNKGERLGKEGDAYASLQQEASRLRRDNDALMADVDKLKEERAKYVALELGELDEANLADVTKHIQDLDSQGAGVRRQHFEKVKDIGLLKKTMFKIAKRSEVLTLVDQVEKSFHEGNALSPDGAEAAALTDLVRRLREELKKVAPKIVACEQGLEKHLKLIHDTESAIHKVNAIPNREADGMRMELISQLQQVKRMNAQLQRLRDIQIENVQEINMLDRVRLKLTRHERVRTMIAAGDPQEIRSKIAMLNEDSDSLQQKIQGIESGVGTIAESTAAIIEQLRSKKDEFSAETGKWRENLVANIRQEEQRKMQLAALRGEKVQNVRFVAMLKAAII